MSADDDMVDSRTQTVGRKRGLAELEQVDSHELDTEDPATTRKRARQDGVDVSEPETTVSPVSLIIASAGPNNQDLPATEPSIVEPGRVLSWNKGVQAGAGLRTSFGARKSSKSAFARKTEESSSPGSSETDLGEAASTIDTGGPNSTSIAQVHIHNDLNDEGSSTIAAFGVHKAVDDVYPDIARQGTQSAGHRQSEEPSYSTKAFNDGVAGETCGLESKASPGKPQHNDSIELKDRKDAQLLGATTKPSGQLEHDGQNHGNTFEVRQSPQPSRKSSRTGEVVTMEAASKQANAKTKPIEKTKTKEKSLGKAARKREFESGTNSERCISRYKCSTQEEKLALDPNVRQFYEELVEEQKMFAKDRPKKVSAPDNASSRAIEAESSSKEEEETHSKKEPGEVLSSLTPREIELQQRYFPTLDGKVRVAHCLACMKINHATSDCPSLSCPRCGDDSDHTDSSCPFNQRCGRCRNQGHGTADCPEKLARIGEEAVPCDLCGSSEHVEGQCQLVWRSFVPRHEDILTIQSLTIDCFSCGQSGHFGPDCGLYQGRGSTTWSSESYDKYVDPNSSRQAICVQVDLAVSSKKQPLLNIKGAADEDITVESDDDMSNFIQAKVNTQSKPKGRIQLGNLKMSSDPRKNSGRELRSGFGQDSNAPVLPVRKSFASARYGREPTFSPPPRFDNNADFVSFDRFGGNASKHSFDRSFSTSQHREVGMPSGGSRGSTFGRGRSQGAKPISANRSGGKGHPPRKAARGRGRGTRG